MTTEASPETPRRRGSRLLGVLALLPIFTAILYLNGWAYHEGYLDYFHLPSSMFPLDLQATLVHGVLAWMYGGLKALTWMTHSVVNHWVLVATSILVVASVGPLRQFFTEFLRTKRLPAFLTGWQLPEWMKKFVLELLRGVSVIYLVFYIPFAMLSVMLLVLVVLVAPFQGVGKDIAAKDVQKNFADSPEDSLTGPDGVRRTLRVISCEGEFCALFAAGHATVVPRDSVTWADAPMAGPTQPPHN